jgi:hypothetical protein
MTVPAVSDAGENKPAPALYFLDGVIGSPACTSNSGPSGHGKPREVGGTTSAVALGSVLSFRCCTVFPDDFQAMNLAHREPRLFSAQYPV